MLPYDKMHHRLSRAQTTWQVMILAFLVSVTVSIRVFSFTSNQGWSTALTTSIFAWIVCFGIALCVVFAYRGLGFGISDEKLIAIGISFLRQENPNDHVLETMKTRAEIGGTLGQMRSLIPILVIPIVISLLVNVGAILLEVWLFIGLGILIFSLPLTQEVYNSRIDSLMRHAIAEYQCEQANARNYSNETDTTLLETLITLEGNQNN